MNFREKIIAWLVDEDHEVKSEAPPAGAPVEWLVKVSVKAPLRVNVLVQQPSSKKDRVVVSLGVALSDVHRRELMKLGEKDRLRIVSDIYRDVLLMCPDCIAIVQPSLVEPQGIAVSRVIYHESLTRETIASTVRLFVNIFASIVAALNARLGMVGERRPGRDSSLGFI
ncbi:MAG: DUF2299 family protein [Desulfurococcales archaeon]|nr:DUF2299 family protein [Desulfurococcales archaeon]